MKVFISSMISGFESFRSAARSAVTTLRHQPIMAEDFGARPATPQLTCLQGVREADLVVFVLGERYGTVQGSSGVSPTHEEFLEAKDSKNLLVFVQQGVSHEPQQAKFISEVQAWQSGFFRKGFHTADELKDAIVQAVHDHQLANAVAPLNVPALVDFAAKLLPNERRRRQSSRGMLHVAIAGGPLQRILRPAELEDQALVQKLHQQARFGEPRLFDDAKGMTSDMDGDALVLEQEDGARIQLDEKGAMLLQLPLGRGQQQRQIGFSAIIEEDVIREITTALVFGNWALEQIDPSQRLGHIAIAATIDASDFMAWRTQAEQDASPNSGSIGFGGGDASLIVEGDWSRPALRMEVHRMAEDLTVRLRRLWKKR